MAVHRRMKRAIKLLFIHVDAHNFLSYYFSEAYYTVRKVIQCTEKLKECHCLKLNCVSIEAG